MLESVLFPIVSKINEYLSNYILIFLLVGVGLWYSIKTRFVQVRCFGEGMKKFFGEMNLRGGAQKSGMTSFQALATAIAAQVGTGNIVGASGAILTGGPGTGKTTVIKAILDIFDIIGIFPHLIHIDNAEYTDKTFFHVIYRCYDIAVDIIVIRQSAISQIV